MKLTDDRQRPDPAATADGTRFARPRARNLQTTFSFPSIDGAFVMIVFAAKPSEPVK